MPNIRRIVASVVVTALLCLLTAPPLHAADAVAFPSTTIDLGTVVSDLDKSVRFYTEGIGFRELKGFNVSADITAAAGLTDSKPLSIRVLVLGEGPSATKLKLMQVAGTTPRQGDNDFIHSHTGFRYLTITVHDTDAAVERLAKLGVKPMAKSPVALPESLAPGMYLTCVRDPDGNIVELLGPRK